MPTQTTSHNSTEHVPSAGGLEVEESRRPLIDHTSLQRILKSIKDNQDHSPSLPFSYCTHILVALMAAISGGLYWFTSDEAAQRYQDEFPSTLGGDWFRYLPQFCGAATNALFNWESYLTLIMLCRNQTSTTNTADHSHSQRGKAITGAIMGIITTLPLLFLALEDTENTSTITQVALWLTALLNLPIYIDSAYTLLTWAEKKQRIHQRQKQQGRSAQQTEELRRKTLAGIQELNMQLTANAIPPETSDIINRFIPYDTIDAATTLTTLSNIEVTPAPQYSCRNYLNPCIYRLLQISGWWQNVGFTYIAFTGMYSQLAKTSFSDTTKMAIAGFVGLTNLATSLGFTVKGIESLHDTLERGRRGEKSIASQLAPISHSALSFLCLAMASGSGFGADQASFESLTTANQTSYPSDQTDSLPWIGAIVSNVGAAFAYNLPQILDAVNRIVEDCFLPTSDQVRRERHTLSKNLGNLAKTIDEMSRRDLDEAMRAGSYNQSQ